MQSSDWSEMDNSGITSCKIKEYTLILQTGGWEHSNNLAYAHPLHISTVTSNPHLTSQIRSIPSEDIELTANSLGAHIETRGKLILRTLSQLQRTHKMIHTVSLS